MAQLWEAVVSFDGVQYAASVAGSTHGGRAINLRGRGGPRASETLDVRPIHLADQASAQKLADLLTDLLGEPKWTVKPIDAGGD